MSKQREYPMSQRKYNWHYKPISLPNIIFSLPTAVIGYHIHSSVFWAIIDFLFWPIVWIKWVICRDVNLSIIKDAFSWFLQ